MPSATKNVGEHVNQSDDDELLTMLFFTRQPVRRARTTARQYLMSARTRSNTQRDLK